MPPAWGDATGGLTPLAKRVVTQEIAAPVRAGGFFVLQHMACGALNSEVGTRIIAPNSYGAALPRSMSLAEIFPSRSEFESPCRGRDSCGTALTFN